MVTYHEIYSRMLDDYNTRTGNYPSESSDVAIRLKVLAGEIFSCYMNLEFIKNQMFLTTATGEYLDYHATQRGLTRKSATKAKGVAEFGTSSSALRTLTIPKGTIISTSGENPVLFETDSDATILKGQERVTVKCTALEGGSNGNVRANKISVIVTPVGEVSLVSNSTSFTGGTDEETDDALRKRINDSLINVSNGANSAYYRKLVLSVDGVDSVGIIPQNRGVGTVDIFIAAKGATVTNELIEEVQKLVDEYKEINTNVLVQKARAYNINISLSVSVKSGFTFSEVKENLTNNIKEFVASSGVGKSIYEADIADVIYHTEGVERYFLSFSDSVVAQSHYPNLTLVNITEGT